MKALAYQIRELQPMSTSIGHSTDEKEKEKKEGK